MLAVQFSSFGLPEVLGLVEVPKPSPKAGQVLVRVQYAALNPKDAMVRKGKLSLFTGSKFPQGLGHDFSGIVEESNSSKYKVGDRVFGMTNTWKTSAYGQFIAVPTSEIALMPDNMPFDQAAAIPLAALTALQALRDLGHLKKGQRVCINGASGGVGTFGIQIAKNLGASVTAISSEPNFALCQALGADSFIDYRSGIPKNIAPEQRFDIFFDVFGNQNLNYISKLLTNRGLLVTTIPSIANVLHTLRTFLWPWGQNAELVVVKSKAADLELLAQWYKAGKIRAVIEKTYNLSDAAEAHRAIETKRTRGKIVLRANTDA
jgi:NADPH:quinone reductase-like Zn-dependent oxidoreductase